MDRPISKELFEKVREQRNVLLIALRQIADLDEKSCEKYVAKADGIAIEALVKVETDTTGVSRKKKAA